MTQQRHDLPWRAPLDDGWQARSKALAGRLDMAPVDPEVARACSTELRRLAGQRLGPTENVRLNRLATKAFALREHLPGFRALRVGILGNRTLDFFGAELRGAGLSRGLLVEPVVSGYDVVGSIAFGDAIWDAGGQLDAMILMLDENAFGPPGKLLDADDEEAHLTSAVERLTQTVQTLRERFSAPVVVATLPQRPETVVASFDRGVPGTVGRFIERINSHIIGGGSGDWITFDLDSLARQVGVSNWFDPVRYHESKVPFALEYCPLAADRACAILAAMFGKSGRALVFDLDNTVWGGVIGDDGLEGIVIGQGSPRGEAFLAVQQMALELRKRGVVLAVCSKNDEGVAKRPFQDHPDMVLRLEHVAVFQANWHDKATNLASIAESLRLGLDSLVFVDDNPAERERVRRELPTVYVPELGDDPSFYPRTILGSGVFEQSRLLKEDLARVDSYGSAARRAELLSKVGNYNEYLESLCMRMAISPFDRVGRARIAQLIAKSNQFNLTTRRYNEAQLAAMENDPSILQWQVRLTDTFADHGMIGVVIVHKDARRWTIDTWLMSCRVLERGVERAIMQGLIEAAQAEGADSLIGVYIPTERNRLVESFYDNFGFRRLPICADGGRDIHYELDVADFAFEDVQIEMVATPGRGCSGANRSNTG